MNGIYANIRRVLGRMQRSAVRPAMNIDLPADPVEAERSKREKERVYAKYGYLLFINPYH
ncbi:MAG: hypothetical protein F7C35_03405 [Desulfurococcales archaeon]|nr:hypothetical protein [Desulfurococcales archaeon]